MKKLFILLLPILLAACQPSSDWELTYKTVQTRRTPIIETTSTSTHKEVLLDYTEKKVKEHIEATTGYTVEYVGSTKYTTVITCTYIEL